jgi:DNA topoisomerase-1
MVIKDGRFGPYVTDGETNASLRKGDEVASISVQRAAELLADRRTAPPSPRRRASAPRASSTTRKPTAAGGKAGRAGTTARSASKRSLSERTGGYSHPGVEPKITIKD